MATERLSHRVEALGDMLSVVSQSGMGEGRVYRGEASVRLENAT
jgi:hypothetical protein